jgi:hypothetical protein
LTDHAATANGGVHTRVAVTKRPIPGNSLYVHPPTMLSWVSICVYWRGFLAFVFGCLSFQINVVLKRLELGTGPLRTTKDKPARARRRMCSSPVTLTP